MYFVVILAFALTFSSDLPVPQLSLLNGVSDLASVPAVGGLVLLVGVAAWLGRAWAALHLDGTLTGHDAATHAFSRAQSILVGLVAAALVTGMVCTPWPRLVRQGWGLGEFPLLADVVILLPFVLSLLVVWTVFYRLELALRRGPAAVACADSAAPSASDANVTPTPFEPDAALGRYLVDKLRHQFLIIAAPMLLVLLAKHYTDRYRDELWRFTALPWLADAILGTASLVVLVLSPAMLRFIWSTQPLPPGPLRRRFAAICRRIGLRYREILVWRTHGMAINAAVMGFIPQLRYILVSDALLETMDEDEIEAVFGHEAGHVWHWHLPYFGIFALVTMYLTGAATLVLLACRARFDVPLDDGAVNLAALALLMLLWLFGFGWLSRKFERQADVFGVRCVTPDVRTCLSRCPVHGSVRGEGLCVAAANLFGRTLRKIAELNGIPLAAPSWRHGSIQSRCQLLEAFTSEPAALARFDRSMRRLKAVLFAVCAVGTAATVWLYLPTMAPILGG